MTCIQEKIVKPMLGLLELAKQLGSVNQACKVMGTAGTATTGSRSSTIKLAKRS